jgi:hypothetical protein
MTIEIGEGRSGTIEVRDGDDTLELASAFCVMHMLQVETIVESLSQSIKNTLLDAIRIRPLNFTPPDASSSPLTEAHLLVEHNSDELDSDPTSSRDTEPAHWPDPAAHGPGPSKQGEGQDLSARASPAAAQPAWYHKLCEKAIQQVERRRRKLTETTAAASTATARAGARRRCVRFPPRIPEHTALSPPVSRAQCPPLTRATRHTATGPQGLARPPSGICMAPGLLFPPAARRPLPAHPGLSPPPPPAWATEPAAAETDSPMPRTPAVAAHRRRRPSPLQHRGQRAGARSLRPRGDRRRPVPGRTTAAGPPPRAHTPTTLGSGSPR